MSDLLIVTPPFSPFDAGPPLGPAVLIAHARAAGLTADALDLNIRYLRQFVGGARSRLRVLGDHAKDLDRVDRARQHFSKSLLIPSADPTSVPCCTDPVLALPHDFEAIDASVCAMLKGPFWQSFLDAHLSATHRPRVLGVSIMGPAQVLPALAVAAWARKAWPGTVVVAGGSHVTLLADEIARDLRYSHGGLLAAVLPGHSEHTLVDLVLAVREGNYWPSRGVLVPGRPWRRAEELAPDQWLAPTIEPDELALYDLERLSIPLQTGRGCAYGRCSFCTYPAVEEPCQGWPEAAVHGLLDQAAAAGARRVSVKDSLMDLPRMRRFGSAVRSRAPGLEWSATTKLVAALDRDALAWLYREGCRTLEFGVETLHPRLQVVIQKRQSVGLVEQVIDACVEVGIVPVINLLYGLPGERREEAEAQLAWWRSWHDRTGGLVHGSHNLVEVNRMSPFAMDPARYGIALGSVGPWAFSYCWDAPVWRPAFARHLNDAVRWKEAA
jgi:hypothetical protein